MNKKVQVKKTGKVTPRPSGANCSTTSISDLMVLSGIREAIGCGVRPMQSELVEMVKGLVFIARRLCKEHQELKNFTAGFGKTEPCECEACDKARGILL